MTSALKELGTLISHKQQVTCINVPDEGNSPIFYTSSRDKKIFQWTLTSSDQIALITKAYENSTHFVNSIASSKANKIVSGGADKLARIYNTITKECTVMRGHTRDITCIIINQSEDVIVTGSIDGTLRLWNSNGEEKECFGRTHRNNHNGWITCASFVPGTDLVVTGGNDGLMKTWDINTGEVLSTFCKGEQYENDGSRMIAKTEHDSEQPYALKPAYARSPGAVISLCVTPCGLYSAYGGRDCEVYIINLQKKELIRVLKTETAITALAFAWVESIIAVGTKKHLYIWDIVDEKVIAKIPSSDFSNGAFVTALAWSKQVLMAGLSDGQVRVYDYSKEEE